MKTDCLALLCTAEGGLARATESHRPLARVWAHIGGAMDGNICVLATERKLIWMPAHQSLAAVGNATLSSGKELSTVDWRANRLVDALAKRAAAQRQTPGITKILGSGRAAVRHAAALLGQVTHTANNCVMECVLPNGETERRVCRDAQQPTFARKRERPSSTEAPPPPAQPAPRPDGQGRAVVRTEVEMADWPGRGSAARERTILLHAEEEWHTRRRVVELASACKPAVDQPSGAERLEQLRKRVRARSSGHSA